MSTLFSPLSLRSLRLSNRIVIAPMCQYSAVDGVAQPWHTVHLGQLALSGAGLLIGAELAGPLRGKAKTLTNLAAEEGVIALIAGPDVLRFAPALNIPLADIAEAFVRLDRAVARLTR